jgi:hypothetical protein
MGDSTGEANRGVVRLDFDRRLMLQFHRSAITSDAGLLAYRELGDTLGFADRGADTLDEVHLRRPPKTIVLDMDASESTTYREQEGSVYNGHVGCAFYHPLFVFNQLGDVERCVLRPVRCTAAPSGARCWNR